MRVRIGMQGSLERNPARMSEGRAENALVGFWAGVQGCACGVQGSLELNMARISEGRAQNERLAAGLARAKEEEALLRQDTAAQQAYTQALLAGDACAPQALHVVRVKSAHAVPRKPVLSWCG